MTFAATVLTLFPDMFPGPLGHSLAGRALEKDIWSLDMVQIRDHAVGKHHTVDDTPAGGGAGMVMRPDVVAGAIDSVERNDRPLIYLSARGTPITQKKVKDLAAGPGAILLCGRFEGIDQRVLDARKVEEIAVGDVVLSGGEPAALLLLDAVIRLLPGVLGAPETLDEESHEDGLLEYPQFTRPRTFEGVDIPDIILSGDHGRIAAWRQRQREAITRLRRPDMWAQYRATADQIPDEDQD